MPAFSLSCCKLSRLISPVEAKSSSLSSLYTLPTTSLLAWGQMITILLTISLQVPISILENARSSTICGLKRDHLILYVDQPYMS